MLLTVLVLSNADQHTAELEFFTCPGGLPIPHCSPPPCSGICYSYQQAQCQKDYCGGCLSRYYYGGSEVTDFCSNPTGLSQQYVPVHTQYPPAKGSTTADSQYPYKGYTAPRGPLPAQYTPPPGVSSSYQQVPKWKETKVSYGYNPPVNSQSRDPYVAPAVQYQSPGHQQTVENSYPAGRQGEANGRVYKPYTATIKDSYGYRTYDRSNPNTQQQGDVQTPVPYYMNRFSNQADRMSYGYRQGESVTTSNDNWKPVSYYSREELLDAYAQRASREEASQDVHHTDAPGAEYRSRK